MHTCIWYIFFSLAFLLLCIIFICSMLFVFLFDLNLVFLQKRRFSHINIHLSNYINYLVLIFFLLNFFVLFWNKTSYIHTHASTHVHMYVCATCCNLRISEKSSTSIISLIKCGGERSNTECTVRNSTDHASLWKQIMTSVAGRFSK